MLWCNQLVVRLARAISSVVEHEHEHDAAAHANGDSPPLWQRRLAILRAELAPRRLPALVEDEGTALGEDEGAALGEVPVTSSAERADPNHRTCATGHVWDTAPNAPALLVVDFMGSADRQRPIGGAPAWAADDGWARWRWDTTMGTHADGFVLYTNAAPCAAFRLSAVVRLTLNLGPNPPLVCFDAGAWACELLSFGEGAQRLAVGQCPLSCHLPSDRTASRRAGALQSGVSPPVLNSICVCA